MYAFVSNVAVVQCVSTPSGTGDVLVEFGLNRPEVCFVEVPGDDNQSFRVCVFTFFDEAVHFFKCSADVCLWRDVNSSHEHSCTLPRQEEQQQLMCSHSRSGEQLGEMNSTSVHHASLMRKYSPPALYFMEESN